MACVDLHVHSAESSDGEVEPRDLVARARRAGVSVLAVADHNNTRAVAAALAAGADLGVTVVPAIEMDCVFQSISLHLLGYNIDHGDPRYRELAENVDGQSRSASRRLIELIQGQGIAVDAEAILGGAKNGIVTAEGIAESVLADPANAGHPLLSPYAAGGARSDNPFVNFYWDHCSPGRPAHVPMRFMALAEAVSLVEDSGGVPVLAHPGVNLKGREDLLPELAAAGVKGVEAYSSYHGAGECERWREGAAGLGLAVTCGSDFHGRYKPPIRLGVHGGDAHEMRAWRDLMRLIR